MVAVNGSYAGLGSDFTLPGVEEGESDVDRFGLGRSGFALTPSPAIGGTSSNRGQGSRAGLDDSQNNSFSNSQTRLTTLSEEEKEDHHGKEWRTFFDRGRKDRKGKGRVRFTGRGGNAVGTAGSAIAKSGREWDPRRWRRWSRKRWAVLIVILFLFTGGIIGGVFGGLSIGREYRKVNKPAQSGPNGSLVVLPWQVSGGLTFDPIKDGPPAGDGKPTFCNAWSPLGHNDPMRSITFSPAGLNQSVATYFLPQNATSVFIHAEGDSSTGTIAMIGKEDLRLLDEADVPEGKIRVDVIMRYSSNATAALVCGMCKDDGSQGVGLYVSPSRVSENFPFGFAQPDPQELSANAQPPHSFRLNHTQPRLPMKSSHPIPISPSSFSSVSRRHATHQIAWKIRLTSLATHQLRRTLLSALYPTST